MNIIEKLKHARRAGVPLIFIGTPDPFATVRMVADKVNNAPILVWDVQRGVLPVNEAGEGALGHIDTDNTEGNPLGLLDEAAKLPDRSILFVHNATKVEEAAGLPWIQGVSNLRDQFKANRRTMILLGRSSGVPAELDGDVYTIDEELPTPEELRAIVLEIDEAAAESIKDRGRCSDEIIDRAVEAIQGLFAFQAEQAVAMAVRQDGIDLDHLWEVKRSMIEETDGLSVWRGGETFSDIKGSENAKKHGRRLIDGRGNYGAVVFWDEIEKMFAGAESANDSGVSSGFLQKMLVYMQDHNVSGMICVGHAGGGKSMYCKAIGNEARIPTIAVDTEAMKGSLVGESGKQLDKALKIITAVSNDRPLFVATCNQIATLPAALRRRFTKGTFFFDLPTPEERDAIWEYYIAKYELTDEQAQVRPVDDGWTGAEIKACCENAWEYNITLLEGAESVTPISKADPEGIERLQKEAAGRYTSASYSGTYKVSKTKSTTRKINLN